LMEEFADSTTALVGDADCTAEGKELCSTHGVSGYPTIKYGDPGDLKDYNGGRSLEDLQKFARESLGPQCGPGDNIELCDADTKAGIEKYVKMSSDRLTGRMRNVEKIYTEDLPMMRKVLAWQKGQAGGKSEL